VTIPLHVREKIGITPHSEVEFIKEGNRAYIKKKSGAAHSVKKFRSLRGIATVKMTTDEIIALTRGKGR
jgi:bifunctional DNA-binding transcriptional regulator/antitoxin component of YhaV-PrlF toxin-antitoxin module